MKKLLPFFLSLFLIFSLAACGKDDSRAEEEAELDAVSSTLNGILTKYTGFEIGIKTDDGEKLTFKECESVKIECKNGIIPGNNVSLIYVGAIEGTDTSNVRVRKLITSDDNTDVLDLAEKAREAITNAGGLVTEESGSQAGQGLPDSGVSLEKVKKTASVISPVNVRSDAQKGSEILGTLDAGESVSVTGICENGWYRIAYEGKTGYVWRDYLSL